MASGNTSATGVYGVSPYNYLTAQSPVDKQAPASPGPFHGNYRTSDSAPPPEEEEEDEKQPYNYLNPYAPAPFQRDGSIRPKEYSSGRDPETGDSHPVSNPAFDNVYEGDNSGQFFPARRDENDYSNQYATYQSQTGNGVSDRQKPYTTPDSDYQLRDGRIPRPQVGNGNNNDKYQSENRYQSNTYNSFDEPQSPSSKNRPLPRDEDLERHYKSDGEGGSKTMKVLGIFLLVILCLGIGFAAGWFASQYLNDDNNSSDSAAAEATTLDAMTTMTTTPTALPPTTTTTTSTTTTTTTTQSPTTEVVLTSVTS